jgi:hypothetical protein
MVSSGMLRRVALVRTNVSEELSASFIRLTRIGELGTTLAVTSNILEDTILHNHRHEKLQILQMQSYHSNRPRRQAHRCVSYGVRTSSTSKKVKLSP